MNTDFMVFDDVIREKQYDKNITSPGDTRYYSDSCKTIKQFAKEQNTVYDPMTNQMLYGINSNMHVSGVSDGTCDQINPMIYTQNYICGAGTAGGNRCVKDAYDIDTFPGVNRFADTNTNQNILKNPNMNILKNPNMNILKNPKENFDLLEYFNSENNGSYNISHFAVMLILIVILMIILYTRTNINNNL